MFGVGLLLFYPENGGGKVFRNVAAYIQNWTATHPRKQFRDTSDLRLDAFPRGSLSQVHYNMGYVLRP
jgi:hypothetical protein